MRTQKGFPSLYVSYFLLGQNPCTNVHCTLGEECAINKMGYAKCECPPPCEPIMRPVCSKDGQTYSSECELARSACVARTTAELAYAGVCGERGPCSDHICKFGATCRVHSGVPMCECPSCSSEFEPVCGSDGVSYGNECKLRLEACRHHKEIKIRYEGPCGKHIDLVDLKRSRPRLQLNCFWNVCRVMFVVADVLCSIAKSIFRIFKIILAALYA